MTEKTLRDIKWLFETLSNGGKTAEFYESQAPILKQAIREIESQQSEMMVTTI